MQSVTYHLEASELDNRLIDSIKSLFKSGRVTVTVEPDTTSLPTAALVEKVKRNETSNVTYVFEGNEFDEVAEKLLHDEPVDTNRYKRTNENS